MLKIKVDKDNFIQSIRSDCFEGDADYTVNDNTIDKVDFSIPVNCYRFENGIAILDNIKYQEYQCDEDIKELRKMRKVQCFTETDCFCKVIEDCFLEPEQKAKLLQLLNGNMRFKELMEWRKQWLDVTETKEIPIKPDWLN